MLAGLERKVSDSFRHWDDPEYYRNLTLFAQCPSSTNPRIYVSLDMVSNARCRLVNAPDCGDRLILPLAKCSALIH